MKVYQTKIIITTIMVTMKVMGLLYEKVRGAEKMDGPVGITSRRNSENA